MLRRSLLWLETKVSIPSLTTAIPDRASGTLTPAAMKVRPMTVSGIPNVKPMTVIIHTITYEYNEIQQMEACKNMEGDI